MSQTSASDVRRMSVMVLRMAGPSCLVPRIGELALTTDRGRGDLLRFGDFFARAACGSNYSNQGGGDWAGRPAEGSRCDPKAGHRARGCSGRGGPPCRGVTLRHQPRTPGAGTDATGRTVLPRCRPATPDQDAWPKGAP